MKRYILILCGCVAYAHADIQRMNLFTPYDMLLRPHNIVTSQWQTTVAHEASVEHHAFQPDDPRGPMGNDFRREVPLLELFQSEQNGLAALKGAPQGAQQAALAQQFSMHDDNGEHGRFSVSADLDVNNTLISVYRHFHQGISFGVHLPVIDMHLCNVQWREKRDDVTFEDRIEPDLISALEGISNTSLRSWKRSGVGDMAAIMSWQRYFPQPKPILYNVAVNVRGGLLFPTGEDRDDNRLLGLPFGHDAGYGFLVAGNLELWLGPYVQYGLDTEIMHHFGATQFRRIQTNLTQTDLLFANRDFVFKEPGLMQHFTIYGKISNYIPGVTARIAYQYTRQNEDKLYLTSDRFNPIVANEAESLQEWTTHSFVGDVTYTFRSVGYEQYKPYISAFAKHGFNGQRAILIDSVGLQVGIDF